MTQPYPPYPPPPPPPRVLPKEAYTPWSQRLWAFLLDWLPFWVIFGVPYPIEWIDGYTNLWAIAAITSWVLCIVYFFWNFCYRQGKTGQSIGKSVMKFMVIKEQTWQPIGFWLSFVRQIAHYIDQMICYIGYLFPLWDDKRQTIADKIMSTVCVPVGTPMPPPTLYPGPYWPTA